MSGYDYINGVYKIVGHGMEERIGDQSHPDPESRGVHFFLCECGWGTSGKEDGTSNGLFQVMAAYNRAMGHLAEQVLK